MAKQTHLQAILSAVDRISPTLKRINTRAGMLHKTFRDVGSSSRNLLAGIGLPATLGLGAIGFGLAGAAKNALDYAGSIQDAEDDTGMLGRAVQELGGVFAAAGIAQEEFLAATTKLNKGLADAGAGKDKGLHGLLTRLRIPLRNAKGEIRSVEEVLPELADAFKKNENPAVRTRMAMELFGKAGGKLIRVLTQGGASLAEARREMDRLGAVLSDTAVKRLDPVGDSFAVLSRQVRVQTAAAFAFAAPAILQATKSLQEWIAKNKDLIQQKLGAYITRIADAFKAWVESGGIERLITSLSSIVDGVASFVRAMGGMRNVLVALGVLILAGPVASLFALGAALTRVAIVAAGPALLALKGLVAGGAWLVAMLNGVQFVLAGMTVGLGSVVVAALPFIAIAAVIAGAAYLIWKNWDTLGPKLAAVWEGIKAGVVAAWQPIEDFILGIWRNVGAVIDRITTGARAVAGAVGGFFSGPTGRAGQGGGFTGASPLVAAGALQSPTARMQAGVRVSFENPPPGMRVQGSESSPGLSMNVDVGRRSTGSIG